jgi:hypothetical protein
MRSEVNVKGKSYQILRYKIKKNKIYNNQKFKNQI